MAWDTVQRKLQCCGIDGPRNWFDTNNSSAAGIPPSCCRPQYIDRETQNCLNAAPLYMDRVFTVSSGENVFVINLIILFVILGRMCLKSSWPRVPKCFNLDRSWNWYCVYSTHGHCPCMLACIGYQEGISLNLMKKRLYWLKNVVIDD